MQISLAFITSALALAAARNDAPWTVGGSYDYERIAGYMPGSQVTDHCAIDLDQKAIEDKLALNTPEAFEAAQRIFEEGGHSESYAELTLTTPLTAGVPRGRRVTGHNADGGEVVGSAYRHYGVGQSVIKVTYSTTDLQASYVTCQVGGLAAEDVNMKGCFVDEGILIIGENEYPYVYIPEVDNKNGRTISDFSRATMEFEGKNCKSCSQGDFQYFHDYYGTHAYAYAWIEGAFKGELTHFHHGNADFSRYTLVGREQAIKKGTACMAIFMYAIHAFQNALDNCEQGCINCNELSTHSWDAGVCFYTGSIEGEDGTTDAGRLLHQLADERCQDFKTCGVRGNETSGTSKLNHDLFDLLSVGNFQLSSGNCPGARVTKERIAAKMYVPLIQGAIRSAYRVGEFRLGEGEGAEGAAFAAAVLPRVHVASAHAALTIYENLRVAAPYTDFMAVKKAFESVYAELGISCHEVGGLWNLQWGHYYPGMEPCTHRHTHSHAHTAHIHDKNAHATAESSDSNALVIALSIAFASIVFVAASVIYLASGEKDERPIFEPSEACNDAVLS